MTVDTSGNVGVGTTNPSYKLSVDTTTNNGGTSTGLHLNNLYGGGYAAGIRLGLTNGVPLNYDAAYIGAENTNNTVNDGGKLSFWTATPGGGQVLSRRMTIDDSGNVGIGTSNPTAGRLSIYQNTDPGITDSALSIVTPGVAGGTAVNQYGIKVDSVSYNNSTAMFGIYSKAFQNTSGVSYGIFGETGGSATSNTYGVYGKGNQLNTNGLGISYGVYGTVISAGANTNGRTYAGYFDNQATTGNTSVGLYVNSVGGALNNYSALFMGGNVGIGITSPTTRLQVAGEISPSVDNTYSLGDGALRFTAVYAVNGAIQTSDARQKKDIQNSDLGLDFINKLRPVSYHWNNGADTDLHYGLIAQETEKAITEAKTQAGTQAGSLEPAIVVHDPVTDRYGLKYAEFIAPIVKALQELYNKILGIENHQSAQDRDLAALKAENAELKAELKVKDDARAKEITEIKTYLCAKEPNAPICK
jgi:hypothetical protein